MMMRTHFQDALTLSEIAESVRLSPFHFNRIFRSITGIPPSMYLAALRIEHAKKLLLTTSLNVTGICFDVGYNSLGTFTTRFTQFVGVPPSHLRQLSQDKGAEKLFQNWPWLQAHLPSLATCSGRHSVEGYISTPYPFDGLIFIGLFADPIPQGVPISCAILTEQGYYSLGLVPEGKYYLFSTILRRSQNLIDLLKGENTLRCSSQHPIFIRHDDTCRIEDLTLSPMHWIDAPILIALPCLLVSYLKAYDPMPF